MYLRVPGCMQWETFEYEKSSHINCSMTGCFIEKSRMCSIEGRVKHVNSLKDYILPYRAQWLRGRASDSRLRGPRFESCDAVLKLWANFTLHCSSSLSCKNEYLVIDSGGYLYEQPLRINCSMVGCFQEKLRQCLIEQVCQGNV